MNQLVALLSLTLLSGFLTSCGNNPHVLGADPENQQPSMAPNAPTADIPAASPGNGDATTGDSHPKSKDPSKQNGSLDAKYCAQEIAAFPISFIVSTPTEALTSDIPTLQFANSGSDHALLTSDFEIQALIAQRPNAVYKLRAETEDSQSVSADLNREARSIRYIVPSNPRITAVEIVVYPCAAQAPASADQE